MNKKEKKNLLFSQYIIYKCWLLYNIYYKKISVLYIFHSSAIFHFYSKLCYILYILEQTNSTNLENKLVKIEFFIECPTRIDLIQLDSSIYSIRYIYMHVVWKKPRDTNTTVTHKNSGHCSCFPCHHGATCLYYIYIVLKYKMKNKNK